MAPQIFDTFRKKIVVSPLALTVILDTHQRVGGKLKHCLCTLIGNLNDDGSILISDAFPNHVIVGEVDGTALPEKTHHDFSVQTRQRINPREIVIGWGTTDLSPSQLQALSDWARHDSRVSKFFPQKRLSSPILLRVTPPTENQNLSLTCHVKGSIPDCLLKPYPVQIGQGNRPGLEMINAVIEDEKFPSVARINKHIAATQNVPVERELMDSLIDKIDAAIRLSKSALSGEEEVSAEIGRALYRAVVPPMSLSAEAWVKRQETDASLYKYIDALTRLQLEMGDKLHCLFA